ncbi:hypothetical protein HOLleu_06988 [Holothuria leucospilota]|uniref:CCHC-type domain-containing protein n=1 Tax=Holothuria leucospilota TaxID=206669 RepID=A0A9Q1CMB9_HOLLE|nr:hypothetical protein HOLleu_06988 [Holothuria leucospilota]
MPEIFEGYKDSWRDYLQHFNSCAGVNGWSDRDKCEFLAVRLGGQAQQFYVDLPDMTKLDFYSLTNAFANHFEPEAQASVIRAQLRGRVRKSGESLSALGASIRREVRRAYLGLSSSAQDQLACDFLIDALPDREFRVLIRRFRPQTLEEAMTVAIELDAIEKTEGMVRSGRSVSSVGTNLGGGNLHDVTPNLELSQRLERIEAQLSYLMNSGNSPYRPNMQPSVSMHPPGYHPFRPPGPTCWNCGMVGHMRAQCPSPLKPANQFAGQGN